jgi:hypothetical protein
LQKGGLFKDLVDAWEQEHSSSKTLSWACAH